MSTISTRTADLLISGHSRLAVNSLQRIADMASRYAKERDRLTQGLTANIHRIATEQIAALGGDLENAIEMIKTEEAPWKDQ